MTQEDIYGVFDEGGALAKGLGGYEFREGQLSMALKVLEAYEEDAILAVEAGTGIGKSFAYLVPALLNAIERPYERTVIATSTINLQKQLFDKDIPILFKLLGKECKVSLALGRGNYLCVRRFVDKREDSSLLAQDPESDLGRLTSWARETKSGRRGDYPFRLPPEFWSDINCDGDLCMGAKCPYVKECFYQKAKKESKEAKIIITNHHLLFSDAAYRYENDAGYDEDGILPSFSRLVIDEAHNMEENATSYFTETYDPKEIKRQTSIILRHSGKNPSLIEALAPFCTIVSLADRILDDIVHIQGAVDTLDQYLIQLFSKTDFQPCLVTIEHRHRLETFAQLARTIYETTGRFASKVEQFVERNNAGEELDAKLHELSVHSKRIEAYGEVLRSFCDFDKWNSDIHWFNPEMGPDKSRRIQVRITPLVIAPLLVDAVFKKLGSVVCTSATLSLHDQFRYWGSRVGLPYDAKRPFLSGTYPSPFDYKHRLLLLTPSDAPPFDPSNVGSYVDYISRTVLGSVRSSEGGALVLFTSYAMLKAVRKRIGPELEKDGMRLFCQGDADRFTLLRNFVSDRDASLMATSSFWEGVDAPGETLRLVVIVKLPFQVPSDPVFKARCDAIDKAGGSGFLQIGLPETTMKLKQGFGRLLRSKEDRGVVLILDGRVMHKSYGLLMLRSLPESFHPDSTSDSVCDLIENFLYGER